MGALDGPYRLADLARDKDNARLDEMGYRAYRMEYVIALRSRLQTAEREPEQHKQAELVDRLHLWSCAKGHLWQQTQGEPMSAYALCTAEQRVTELEGGVERLRGALNEAAYGLEMVAYMSPAALHRGRDAREALSAPDKEGGAG